MRGRNSCLQVIGCQFVATGAAVQVTESLRHHLSVPQPAVLVVAFNALLIILQAGLLLGFFSLKSIPIDHASADIWVAHPAVRSVDVGRPFPETWLDRVAVQPEVVRTETLLMTFLTLNKPDGQSETCILIGCRLDDESLGAVTASHDEQCGAGLDGDRRDIPICRHAAFGTDRKGELRFAERHARGPIRTTRQKAAATVQNDGFGGHQRRRFGPAADIAVMVPARNGNRIDLNGVWPPTPATTPGNTLGVTTDASTAERPRGACHRHQR